ncbi:hypothetical protein [Streptomyces sp. NPDC050164]|uniref:hypothetical protein n=1 Tax=Streptomyces sp. NPDC050164 TaxID=3365605 RepID=UPI00379F05CF
MLLQQVGRAEFGDRERAHLELETVQSLGEPTDHVGCHGVAVPPGRLPRHSLDDGVQVGVGAHRGVDDVGRGGSRSLRMFPYGLAQQATQRSDVLDEDRNTTDLRRFTAEHASRGKHLALCA